GSPASKGRLRSTGAWRRWFHSILADARERGSKGDVAAATKASAKFTIAAAIWKSRFPLAEDAKYLPSHFEHPHEERRRMKKEGKWARIIDVPTPSSSTRRMVGSPALALSRCVYNSSAETFDSFEPAHSPFGFPSMSHRFPLAPFCASKISTPASRPSLS